MSKKSIDFLKEARSRIEDPKRWIKEFYHREVDGVKCYCAVGALDSTLEGIEGFPFDDRLNWADEWSAARDALYNSRPAQFHNVPAFNDDPDTKHEDVLALYDRAIKEVETVNG